MDTLTCEYCDQPPTHITRDDGEHLCGKCLTAQYSNPRDAAAKLTPTTQRMYGHTPLGARVWE